MRLNRFAGALVAVVLLAPAAFAAEDITGKWAGSFIITVDGAEPDDDAAHLVATQKGQELTGTVGPTAERQWPILKGKVVTARVDGKDVTKVTFDVVTEDGGGPLVHFDLELIAGRLKGKAKGELNGRQLSAVADMERVK